MTALLLATLLSSAHAQDAPPPMPDVDAPESAEAANATDEPAEAPDHTGYSEAEHAEGPEIAEEPEAENAEASPEPVSEEVHPESDAHDHEAHTPHPAQPPVRIEVPAPQAPSPGLGTGLFDFLGDDGGDGDALPVGNRPDVVVVNQGNQPITGPFDRILPAGPRPGFRSALPLGLLAVLCVAVATLFRRSTRDLRTSGLIPQILITAEVVFRLLAAAFGIAAIGALVPRALAPALPVVIVAAAIAAGWSARDVLQDLVAGVFLGVEGQLRAGHWVRGDRYSGTVEAMGLRVTWLRDVYGRRIVVPNRVLLAQPLVADDNPWPRIQFTVAMPSEAPTRTIRAALEEAILVSPWVAPTPDVEVHPDGIEPGHWHIAVRLLDSRYADRFQGLLRERVEEILP